MMEKDIALGVYGKLISYGPYEMVISRGTLHYKMSHFLWLMPNLISARAALFAYSDPAEALQIYKTFEKYGKVTL